MTEKKTKKTAKASATSKATKEKAVVVQPTVDKEPIFMAEEVDTLEQTKRAIKPDIKAKLDQFVGKLFADAQADLDALVAAGSIGSFRKVLKGQSFTGDFVSDRVQLFLTGDEITSLEIG